MIITILATTEPKLSHTKDNCVWYKEYGVGQFESERERCSFAEKYRDALNYLSPRVSMRHRVDVVEGDIQYGEWEYLTVEKDIYSAALSIGDSDFYSGKSCNIIHERVNRYSERMNSLQKEFLELEDKITPHKFQRRSNLQEKYNERFELELKTNRVYRSYQGKPQPGTKSQNKIDEIRVRIRSEYDSELSEIGKRIDSVRQELSNMKVEDF